MKAEEKMVTEFLQGEKQFTVPIYQRTYSWELKQFSKLWKDIIKIAENDNIKYYFIGSIVSIEDKLDSSNISKQIIIDGQQRITTILLIISALIKAHQDPYRKKELQELYLINKGDKEEFKYKLVLTKQDKYPLIDIIDNPSNKNLNSPTPFEKIDISFDFFEQRIEKVGLKKIYTGIKKLIIVDISLDSNDGNPHYIFENLNSAGLELSQADMIKNYVFMGLSPKYQEELYDKYWIKNRK